MNETDIAIVGMSCIFPGARNLDEYWSNIVNGVDTIGPVPADRLNGGLNLGPPLVPCLEDVHVSCTRGGFLPDDFRFDPLRYGVLPKNLSDGDPDQFIAISIIDTALRDAGIEELHPLRASCDVIIGRGGYVTNKMTEGYLRVDLFPHLLLYMRQYFPEMGESEFANLAEDMHASLPPDAGPDSTASAISNLVASRAANRLNLQGAAYTVDGACASSLLSVEHAVLRLCTRRCDAAVACGLHLCQLPTFWYVFQQLGALSASNVARPFDRRADGILIGEGAGAVILKRLDDAQRDGDRVYAVIKGVGSSSDGRGSALLSPRSEGQVLALHRAYRSARVDPDSIGYLEAHGTGTPAGDPVEIQTLKTFYGQRPGVPPLRAMGSVKSMIGHTMTAAGIASLIRTALAVSNKVLPPSLNCEEPSSGLDGTTFYVNQRSRPWVHSTHGDPRRAGINAFGFGGINVHLILEEVSEDRATTVMPRPFRDLLRRSSELVAISADSPDDLVSQLEPLTALERGTPLSLAELSRATLKSLDQSKPYKLALVCTDRDDLQRKAGLCRENLERGTSEFMGSDSIFYSDHVVCDGQVAVVFPGIGYPGVVGRFAENLMQLCLHFPEMRKVFDQIELRDLHADDPIPTSLMLSPPPALPEETRAALQSRVGSPRVEDLVVGAEERPAMERNIAPAAVTAADLAGWALLQSLRVPVDVVAGQSMGELAAACAAGILEYREIMQGLWAALAVVPPYREDGRLAFAAARESHIRDALSAAPDVHIAMHIAPEMQLLGGPTQQLDSVIANLRKEGIVANKLPFPPIHTPGGNYLSEALAKGMHADFQVRQAHLPVYSSLSGGFFPEEEQHVRDMAFNVVNRPVRCWQTIRRMYDDGVRVFIETADGGLSATIKSTIPESHATVAELHAKDVDGITLLNRLCGMLYVAGVHVDMTQLHTHCGCGPSSANAPEEWPDKPAASLLLPLRMSMLPFGEEVFRKGRRLLAARSPAHTPQRPHDEASRYNAPIRDTNTDGDGKAADHDEPHEAMSAGTIANESVYSSDPEFETGATYSDVGPPSPVAAQPMTDSVDASQPVNVADDVRKAICDHGWPLLGDVLHFIEGRELVAERVLDLDRDLFLHDHVFIQVWDYKPLEECLPLLPLAAIVEAMAEAAACLAPERGVIGLEQVRALRWVAMRDQRTLPIRIEARVESVDDRTGVVAVRTELSSNGEVNAMATVLLGTAYEQTIDMSFSPRDGGRQWPYAANEFYHDRHTFHGPRLQCLTATLDAGRSGGDVMMELLPVDDWFTDDPQPQLLLDPVALDGVAQTIAMWARGFGRYTLPMGFRKLELYQQTPPRGTQLPVRIEMTKGDESSRTLVFDIEVQDGEGRVWMRLEDFSLWVFEWTTRGIEAQRQPERIYLSDERSVPGQPHDMILASVSRDEIPGGNFDWICRLCLTHPEIEQFNNLESPRRKWQWLYGRLAAKDAVRMWMRRTYDIGFLHPLSFAILNDEHGRPYVHLLEDRPGVPYISITHVEDRSFAAAAATPVGIDVEPANREIDRAARAYITSDEEDQILVSLGSMQDKSQSLLHMWCAKESVGKALGIGLNGKPRALAAIGAEPDGRFLIHHHPTSERHVAQTWQDGPYIGAYAFAEGSAEVLSVHRPPESNSSDDIGSAGITRVSVIGAGTVGWRIAWQCAVHNYEVILYDTSADALDNATDQLHRCAREMVGNGVLSVAEANSTLALISPTLNAVEAAATDILCESVPEQLELKRAVFAQFHELSPPHAMFVTNTSIFLPSMIADDTGRPGLFAALHFHGNVWDTNVVDIMPHPGTDEATVRRLEQFARSIGQIPIIMRKQSYGYVVNAMLMNLNRVALTLAANEVASIDDIDRAFMAVMKAPLGPFGIMDSVGLDTSWQILDYWAGVFQDPQLEKNAAFLQQYLNRGFRGVKDGRGFYSYPDPLYDQPGFLFGEACFVGASGDSMELGQFGA